MTLFKEYSQILLGILLASIGLKAFLLPNGFLDGGVTGIAILLSQEVNLNISILLIVISIPFLILGAFTVSKRIVIKSIVSITLLAIMISLESFETITEDKLLISIFGGVFLGCGIGISIRKGAVLDGSEILGLFLYNKYGISIGQSILVFNAILFSITAYILDVETAMYSILAYLVTAKVIDIFIHGFENFIGLNIVSKSSAVLQKAIKKEIGAGITVFNHIDGYGSTGKAVNVQMTQVIISRIDINKTLRLIESIDPEAFIVEFDVNKVRGGVMRRLLEKKGAKQLPEELRT